METTVTVDTNKLEADVRFEQHYAEVLTFVKKQGHASCFEMMKEFQISYPNSVYLMDTLEARAIVDAAEPEVIGPRPLLNGKKKRCPPTPVISALPNSILTKESEPSAIMAATPVVPNAEAKPILTTTRKRIAVRKSAKRR